MKRPASKVIKFIYEKNFGKLPKGWHIHHLDGNPWNNEPFNLLGCSPEKHWAIHYQQGDAIAKHGKFIQSAGMPGEKHPFYGMRGEGTPMYGKSHSEESKQKMSTNSKGMYDNGDNPRARKVKCNNTGMKWDCIKDAAKELNINYNTLRNRVNQNRGNVRYEKR